MQKEIHMNIIVDVDLLLHYMQNTLLYLSLTIEKMDETFIRFQGESIQNYKNRFTYDSESLAGLPVIKNFEGNAILNMNKTLMDYYYRVKKLLVDLHIIQNYATTISMDYENLYKYHQYNIDIIKPLFDEFLERINKKGA